IPLKDLNSIRSSLATVKNAARDEPNYYQLKRLHNLKDRGKKTVQCDISGDDVDIASLIDDTLVKRPSTDPKSDSKPEDSHSGTTSTQLFTTYARKDKVFAKRLADDLSKSGLQIWMDTRDIPAGNKWDREIQNGLDTSNIMLVLLSPASVASENVTDEWN